MKARVGAVILAIVLIVSLIFAVICIERVPAGYVGVVYNMNGGVDGEVALIQAQKDKEAAAIKAETEVIEAQAAADVARIAAEAEAEANRKIAASITPELIEKIKYERWNGALPKVSSSGGAIVGIDGIE